MSKYSVPIERLETCHIAVILFCRVIRVFMWNLNEYLFCDAII